MKRVYTHTFSPERQKVDTMIDTYFEEQFGISDSDLPAGYAAWLHNIGRQDTPELREKYSAFMKSIQM